jgi:HK97 family phage major capsid protein
MRNAFDIARAQKRRYYVEGLSALEQMEPAHDEPIPWAERLRGFAQGTYRKRNSADLERIEEVERLLGVTDRPPHSFTVFPQSLGLGYNTRADIVGTTTAGGFLVDTVNQGYIPALQPSATPGTRVIDYVDQRALPVNGNISIPSSTAPLSLQFLPTETTQGTDSTSTTGQVAGTPHVGYLSVSYSRLLDIQSTPAMDSWLWLELKNALHVGVSGVILNGSGSAGQPHGIIGLTGVGTSSGATIALSNLVTAQETVAAANAVLDPDRVAFFAPPATAGLLMQRFSSPKVEPLWVGDINTGSMVGVPALSTSSMPASTLIYGDFSQILLPIWGGITIEVDPYQGPGGSGNFQKGLITARLMVAFDVMVRHAVSFYTLTGVT